MTIRVMKVKECLGDDEVIESNDEAQQPPAGLEEAYEVI